MARTFVIEIRERKGEVRVRASDGEAGKASAEPAPKLKETAVRLDKNLRRLELQLPAAAAATAGLALADALPEDVTRRLAATLGRRPAARLDVVFDLGGPRSPRWLHAVPWELLRLPDDVLPVALHEHVALYRRVPEDDGAPPRGGLPLRVLYAVAAPDALAEDVRSSLDWEREEELIFDAVRATVPDAVFETADEGNLAYLEATLPPITWPTCMGARDLASGHRRLQPRRYQHVKLWERPAGT
jgi:hypothetical protein